MKPRDKLTNVTFEIGFGLAEVIWAVRCYSAIPKIAISLIRNEIISVIISLHHTVGTHLQRPISKDRN